VRLRKFDCATGIDLETNEDYPSLHAVANFSSHVETKGHRPQGVRAPCHQLVRCEVRISRKIRNLVRRERRANPTPEMLLLEYRAGTLEKRKTRERAEELYREYGPKGATWAACVQAVKTNWITQFVSKYRE